MTTPRFRYAPQIQDVLRGLPDVYDAKLDSPMVDYVEQLYRRDRQLEDWLGKYAGAGKEYASIVVATANTSPHGRAAADFVGDGVNDQVALTAAVAALNTGLGAPVGRIVMLDGVWGFSGAVTGVMGNVSIVGMGLNETLISVNGTGYTWITGLSEISDLTASATSDATLLSSVGVVSNCTLSTAGVALNAAKNVENCTVTGACTGVAITWRNSSFSASVVGGVDITNSYPSPLQFSDCVSASSPVSITINDGLVGLIRDSFFGRGLIVTYAAAGVPSRVFVTGNYFQDQGGALIGLTVTGNIAGLVESNRFERTAAGAVDNVIIRTAGGFSPSDVLLIANTFQGTSARYNIRVDDAAVVRTQIPYNYYEVAGTLGNISDLGTGTLIGFPASSLPPGAGTPDQNALMYMGAGTETGLRRRLAPPLEVTPDVNSAVLSMASTTGLRRQLATTSGGAAVPAFINEAQIAMASTGGLRRRLAEIQAAASVITETAFGQASAVGTSTGYARTDHTHGSPTDPLPAHVAAGDPHAQYALDTDLADLTPLPSQAGMASTASRPRKGAPGASAPGDAASAGVSQKFAGADHVHAREAAASAFINDAQLSMASTTGLRRQLATAGGAALPAFINEAQIAMGSGESGGVTRTQDPPPPDAPSSSLFWMYA